MAGCTRCAPLRPHALLLEPSYHTPLQYHRMTKRLQLCVISSLQGIFSAATFIHCNTQDALQEAARRCPGWPLLLTGHSLGGGVAALLTMLLQQSGLPPELGPMRCVTIGTGAAASGGRGCCFHRRPD